MTDTSKYLSRMVIFLVILGVGVATIAKILIPIFQVNPLLNGLIFAVILIGTILNFRQVVLLGPEARWMEQFGDEPATGTDNNDDQLRADPEPPKLRLLSPMARMLSEKRSRGRLMLSAPAMRTLLDGIASRLEESRDLARYLTGLCIFLGLLGTFWGLLATVKSIADVIRNLSVTGDDLAVVFSSLKKGLEAPLTGMGTAFSSSLFGLAGSLVLGFLDLQAGQAQNAFFNELEEWLSGVTRLSSGTGDSEQGVSVYTEALLEQTAERLQDLVTLISRSEQARMNANQQFSELNANLGILADQMRAEQQLLLRMAENQRELTPAIRGLAESLGHVGTIEGRQMPLLDDATRAHIRSIDSALGRLTASLDASREETVRDIRTEIKLLARTVAGLGGHPVSPRDSDGMA
ncbi:MAG: flagellar motor protein MotA [Rhodospirillaceae bacterium]|nr:MAG: flagellar motor protein MotA [Rhodospirillaceae bacterium]